MHEQYAPQMYLGARLCDAEAGIAPHVKQKSRNNVFLFSRSEERRVGKECLL